jgi:hypothetical protein
MKRSLQFLIGLKNPKRFDAFGKVTLMAQNILAAEQTRSMRLGNVSFLRRRMYYSLLGAQLDRALSRGVRGALPPFAPSAPYGSRYDGNRRLRCTKIAFELMGMRS